MTRRLTIPLDEPLGGVEALPALLDEAGDPRWCLVLAPGAGASMTGEVLAQVAREVAAGGVRVVRFDFPYTVRAKKAPDRPAVLAGAWRAVLDHVRAKPSAPRLAIGGKSMGGRYATMLAAEAPGAAAACVLYGYPLHPPGKPEKLRDAHLYDVHVPCLFFGGTRDALARADLLTDVVARMGAAARLVGVPDADHDFRAPKRTGRTREEIVAEMAEETVRWLTNLS